MAQIKTWGTRRECHDTVEKLFAGREVLGLFHQRKEFDVRRNIFTVAPTVSKGFSFWGNEAFPFFSLPVGVNLNGDSKTYETQINANLGITGNLPIEGYRNIMGTVETTVDVKDSFTAFFVGLSYPLN